MSSSNRTDNANNNLNKNLIEAIRNQQYDKVKNILEHHRDNIDINGYIDDDSKYTILREACSTNFPTTDARIVALLLEYGADPNHGNELVEMNGERYYSNENSPVWRRGFSPRTRFIVQKDILSHLLRYGADPNVIHPEIGWSPLHSGCRWARYDEIELLLQHGANPNQLDRDGNSPMFDLLNRTEVHILQPGATPSFKGFLDDDADRYLSCLRLLLEYGADLNMNSRRGMNPLKQTLCHATGECRWNFIRLMMQHGADATIPLSNGDTVLHHAVYCCDVNLIELLLRHGANPNQLDRDGKSPMFDMLTRTYHSQVPPNCYFLNNNHLSCIRLLLEYGADPNMNSRCGMTPLFQAIYHASGECRLNFIRLWMQHGADVTIPLSMTPPSYIHCGNCIKGDTILHAAVRLCDVDVIRLMTESRAITSFWWLRNDDGDTVYDLAAKSKDATPIIEYLDMKWRQECYVFLRYDWIHKKPCSHLWEGVVKSPYPIEQCQSTGRLLQ